MKKRLTAIAFIFAFFILLIPFFFFIQQSDAELQKPLAEIVLYNWKDFTDKEMLKKFKDETGISVILREYETMEMSVSEFQFNPEGFDVIIVENNLPEFLEKIRLIRDFDLSKIPNIENLENDYRKRLPHAIPYLSGTTGYIINTDFVKEKADSLSVLWNEKYKGKIVLLDDHREFMAIILKSLGYSINSVNPRELKEAEAKALLLKNNNIEFGETFGNIKKVISGEKWIAQTYSGDMLYKARNYKNIVFVLPKEGFNLWTEYFMISAATGQYEEVHKLVDFFLRPENAAMSAKKFFYNAPVKGIAAYLDKDFAQNATVFPPEEQFKKGERLKDIGSATKEYQRIFNMMKEPNDEKRR